MTGFFERIGTILRSRGIFFRLFVVMMLLSLLLISAFAAMIIPRERAALVQAMTSQASNIAASISEATASSFLTADYGPVVEHNLHLIRRSSDILYIIAMRESGFCLVNTRDGWETREAPAVAWSGRELGLEVGIIDSTLVGGKAFHFGMPLEFTGYQWGFLYIGLSVDHFQTQVRDTYRFIFYLSAICLVLAAILSYFLASRFTRPIRSLRHAALQIAEGDLTARAGISRNDEVGELALSFNVMTEKMIASQKKIQDAYDELGLYQKNLEKLVRSRTEELTVTNRRLGEELAERQRAEQALAESERRYRVIFETAGSANMIVGQDDTIVMVNAAFEKISGFARADVEGRKTWLDFFSMEDQNKLRRRRARADVGRPGALEDFEATLIDSDAESRAVYLTVGAIPGASQTIFSFIDLTEIKRLEAQLLQSQKMEAVGQLAGGVAHDFNNILTAITGYASLLKMQIHSDEVLLPYVEPIISSAEKAAQLTQGLLAFSRKQIIEPKQININDVIRKLEHLLKRLLGEDIELHAELSALPLVVFADVGQIEQVLMNLATNARDAMPEGGYLSVGTDVVMLSQEDFIGEDVFEMKPGQYALVRVFDTGSGMSRETIDHIFEPFFTTKEVGKGTGLGLAIVYGVIKQHNGSIHVYSEPGSGTTFKVYLPLVAVQQDRERPAELKHPEKGHETILLAEDDDMTRELSHLVLEKFGYFVLEAADGEEAVEKFIKYQDRIDLVLLDVIMPKKNGRAVYDEILQIKPDAKALFISGYTADIIHKKGIFESHINFISKPVTPEALARKVREVLDKG